MQIIATGKPRNEALQISYDISEEQSTTEIEVWF